MTQEPRTLLERSDRELRTLASEATHQHFRGGLYRLIGTLCDADTGQPVKGKDGAARVLYEHLFPYERQFWLRDHTEFFGIVLSAEGEWVERFRKLNC